MADGQALKTQAPQNPIQMEMKSDAEYNATMILAAHSLYENMGKVYPEDAHFITQRVWKSMKTLAQNGWANNYAETLLAIQQFPATAPNGQDNAREISARIVGKTLSAPPESDTVLFCQPNNKCEEKLITRDELGFILSDDETLKAPDLNPNRAIPVTRGVAAINGFFDAIMNTPRYLDLVDGKQPPPHNMTQALAEKVSQIHQNNPDTDSYILLDKCIKNNPYPTIKECTTAGVRLGLSYLNATGIRYDGSAQIESAVKPNVTAIANAAEIFK